MSASPEQQRAEFKSMQHVIHDLSQEKRIIYWRDLCVDLTIAWGAFFLPMAFPMPIVLHIIFLLLSARGFLGLLVTIHEIAHSRGGPAFKAAWSYCFGTMFLVHSFMYLRLHLHHHRNYATEDDGEYIQMTKKPHTYFFLAIAWNFLLPIMAIIRFALMTPLSFFSRRFRTHMYLNFAEVGMKFSPTCEGPKNAKEAQEWRFYETLSMIFVWFVINGLIAQTIPILFVIQWYAVMVAFLIMNALRGLSAHQYALHSTGEMSLMEQLNDSTNITAQTFSTSWFCPHNMQYHALHHLFPNLPYHSLKTAHHRLMAHVSPDSDYRKVNIKTVWEGLNRLQKSMVKH